MSCVVVGGVCWIVGALCGVFTMALVSINKNTDIIDHKGVKQDADR